MISIPPTITVHTLTDAHCGVLTRFLAPRIAAAPYSSAMDEAAVRREVMAEPPPAVFPVRWQQHRRLGAWRAGQLVGFLDAAVGLDSESLDRPDYRPFGLIRFLALPDRPELIADAAAALLNAAQRFWQETGIAYVKAFHLSTGYPSFQAGAGLLPGDWGEQIRVLTGADFLLRERYYCFYRLLTDVHEEVTPLADLSLVYRGDRDDRRYELYYRRIDWVGRARLVRSRVISPQGKLPIAYLTDLYIDRPWRQQNIGKWLLRRLINDATLQGDAQMVLHLAHHQHAAVNLFIQQGFQELSYRGYTLEKALTQ
ncbi:MAG TPA: GNAT family N-acetyltransferase [Caldilineaceae bacterium]|nr:GNAT family N-acetyltransferase [Caldilineaceae bacterium]